MAEISIIQQISPLMNEREIEIVERKGLGHPDTVCDALMETLSVALCSAYLQTAGRILHHNLDKGLLVAGQTTPALTGGQVHAPMRIIIGDRASLQWQGKNIPINDLVETTAIDWLRRHLRYVDPEKHVVLQNELRPGSQELADIFARKELTANDTSVGVGYAPLSETERLVLEAEHFLNSAEFKSRHPESGEDVKVMGVRTGRRLRLTIAVAMVDRWITTIDEYFVKKAILAQELRTHLLPLLKEIQELEITINALDDPDRGMDGMYLTVLGTSAEGADGGEVGRGNRVNGLISFHRPMTLEAAAGKNPVSHVGKIYNILSGRIARHLHSEVDGILEATVWLCSQIGSRLSEPWSTSVELQLSLGAHLRDVEPQVREIVQRELNNVSSLVERLCRGEIPVC